MHATLHNDGLEHRFFYVLFYVEIFQHYFSPFRCQPPKMVKHTQTIRSLFLCLSLSLSLSLSPSPYQLALDPSGMYVAISGSDKAVCVFDFRSGECLARLYGHSGKVDTSKKVTVSCCLII